MTNGTGRPRAKLRAPLERGARVLRSLAIAGAAAWLAAAPPAASAAPSPTIHTIDLPGGVEGIRRAIGDRKAMAPAVVAVEIARRFHDSTAEAASDDAGLARLRRWLRACERDAGCGGPGLPADRVPLAGDPAFWNRVLLDGRVPPAQVILTVLGRRDAALFHAALLSMREDVRAWLLARPALARNLMPDAGPLLVAAPYLRLAQDRWSLPGGAAAAPVWAALASVASEEPEALLTGLVRAHGGLVAYQLEVVASLDADQQGVALALAAPDTATRIAAGAALLDGLRTATPGWRIHERAFWRPSHDPAFLLAQIAVRDGGRLALPGGAAFWSLVFADGPLAPHEAAVRDAWRDAAPVAPGWLVSRVWEVASADRWLRYEQVLFAARRLAAADASQARDAATALRGYARYPQLLRVLDRLEVADPARLAGLVRRADALADAGGGWRARGAVVRWQTAIAALDAMARLGAADRAEVEAGLDRLAEAGVPDGTPGGRLRALLGALGVAGPAGDLPGRAIERALLTRLTRNTVAAGRRVTWEGLAYRIDVGAAERDRLTRVRGRDALPRLDAAWIALALAEPGGPATDAARARATLDAIVAATRLDREPDVDEALGREARLAAAAARRALSRPGAVPGTGDARTALEELGEALATEACAELAYALGMGWAEDLPLTALAASRRHVFTTLSPAGATDASWRTPAIATSRQTAWHVVGSLLGLDDALAGVALRRPSLRPVAAAPSLNTGDRRWLLSTVAALDRRRFTDAAQAAVVALVARGRARASAIDAPAAAREAAELAGASPLRQALAAWIAEVDPGRLSGVFSVTELARLGGAGAAWPRALDGWGNAQASITGRLAAGPLPNWPWERYAGRSTRTVSCALPDLQLTLAVRLAELHLPAVLVPDLMPAATYELVHTAAPLHADDVDALAAHVRRVDAGAVERYLAMLTTAGPLRAEPAARTP